MTHSFLSSSSIIALRFDSCDTSSTGGSVFSLNGCSVNVVKTVMCLYGVFEKECTYFLNSKLENFFMQEQITFYAGANHLTRTAKPRYIKMRGGVDGDFTSIKKAYHTFKFNH